VVGRPYILFASLNQLPMVGGSMQVENERILRIYTIDPKRFKSEINVLVEHRTDQKGLPRCVISAEGKDMATAGVNWKSPGFAEIYVYTEPQARNRGWGSHVVSCITTRLLNDGIRPVYLAEHNNEASRNLIESLGYYDTGSRQVYADTIYTGYPLD
jgi:predicted GNAT family acetyltransferase